MFIALALALALAFDPPPQVQPQSLDAALTSAVKEARAAVFADGDGWRARSDAQCFTAHFDGRGVVIDPSGDAPTIGLELARFGRLGHTAPTSSPTGTHATGPRLQREWSDVLTEWYVNGPSGLEHGFDVRSRPLGDGALAFEFDVSGGLAPAIEHGERSAVFFDASGSARWTYSGLMAFDAGGTQLSASMTLVDERLVIEVDDAGAVYPVTVDPVFQQAYIKASNSDSSDLFGFSVAVSGDAAVVGAWGEDSIATGVGGVETDNSNFTSGAAYVFRRTGYVWAQEAYLKASDSDPADDFGWSVAIDGDTVVVGARRESSAATGVDGADFDNSAPQAGAVYVFKRTLGVWGQEAYLKASNTDATDYFGYSVAIDGDTIVVGALLEDSNAVAVGGLESDDSALDSGAAYVFHRVLGVWTQQAYLKASNTGGSDFFGCSVDVSGDVAVVGAWSEDSNSTVIDFGAANNAAMDAGAAYVYRRTGIVWSFETYLKPTNTQTLDRFGSAVVVSGDLIAVGAPFEDSFSGGVGANQFDNLAVEAGAVYVFEHNGSAWVQDEYIKTAGPAAGEEFGAALALDGERLAVGAPGEQSAGVGPFSNQLDGSLGDAGAVVVFERVGTVWMQKTYLKASNTGINDRFGESVGLSGLTVFVGAAGEDSSDVGVDGDDTDNSSADAGAAYVFDLCAPWGVVPGCLGNTAKFLIPTTLPQANAVVEIIVQSSFSPPAHAFLYYGLLEIDVLGCGVPFGADELLLSLTPLPVFIGSAPVDAASLAHFNLHIPPNPTLTGLKIAFQAVVFDLITFTSELSDALEMTLLP